MRFTPDAARVMPSMTLSHNAFDRTWWWETMLSNLTQRLLI
jgi:hypothetical protein